MGVTLFCLGRKAFESLESLKLELIPLIDCIVIGQDRNVANDFNTEIKQWAKKNQIAHLYRQFFDNNIYLSQYNITIGWRWIIKVEHNQHLIIFHDSLLPRYRGFNPLVTALINGDLEIGATALLGSDEYDKGDIISQKKISIKYPIKIYDAINEISILYSELLNEIMLTIKYGQNITSKTQNESLATYSLWRDDEDYKIDWNKNADEIKRFVDAVGFPYKGSFTYLKTEKIRISDVIVEPDIYIANRDVGKVIFKKNGNPVVVCGKGLVQIIKAIYESGTEVAFNGLFRIRFR